jgi:ParB family chromosome partitioning protein
MRQDAVAQVIALEVDKIIPDPDNLRQEFDQVDIRALADNILEHGQMDSIQVFALRDGRYQIFDGERRWRACLIAGLRTIKAIVITKPPEQELMYKRVSRAMQSRSLTPQEEVRALENALAELGVASKPEEWGKVAKKLGVPAQLLRDRMKITRLPQAVRQQFEREELDLSAAQALGRLEDQKRQQEVAAFIKENQLHTRFVGTKFIEKLVEHPDKPVLEVYTIALSEQRNPTKVSRKETEQEILADRLEDMLADLRRTNTWLETAGRERLLTQLAERSDTMGQQRLVEEVQRLLAMCRAFLKHAENSKRKPMRALSAKSASHNSS